MNLTFYLIGAPTVDFQPDPVGQPELFEKVNAEGFNDLRVKASDCINMLQMLKYQKESIELYVLWDSADIQGAIKRATNLHKGGNKGYGLGYDAAFLRLLERFIRFLNVAIEHNLKVLLS
jgi:hypothetical protein